ncbi:MAG: hypothetical protein Fur0040_03290 [Sideroxydans sp.]
MQWKERMGWLAAGLLSAAGAWAQEPALDVSTPAQHYVQRAQPWLLAEASPAAATPTPAASVATAPVPYEPPLLSGSNAHLALGLATIAAAAATAVTAPEGYECEVGPCPPPPPRETNGTHAKLAKATIALAAATITSGLLVHWDDFYLEDGFTDPDNLHVMLGVTGAALMAYAVNKSAKSSVPVSHAGIAELGALGMVAAIKLTW